jgi:uncharacterized protein YdeI (YjbR/CyaY-like superfamily)
MAQHDPRVDAYIAQAAPFARPLLEHLRAQVHAACPDVEEAIKWSMPAFLYRGRQLASMAAFKQHASFGFWRGEDVVGEREEGAMGQFGRLRTLEDLPDDARMRELVARAMALIDAGGGRRRTPRAAPRPLPDAPPALVAALDADPAARAAFDAFPPSHRREYIEWIAEAKREDTRARRVAQAIEWIAQGKSRNLKYER